MNLEKYKNVSLELAFNSRVSTGGNPSVIHYGKLREGTLNSEQIEFVFWCLNHAPHIGVKPVGLRYGGKRFDARKLPVGDYQTAFKPSKLTRLQWIDEKDRINVTYSRADENTYWLEVGMGQEMAHIAGAVAQIGVCMIGGVYIDLVPMVPYLSSEPPANYQKSNLPEPTRDGGPSAIECIEGWRPSKRSQFDDATLEQIGQLLWAGLGCTPHPTFRYYRSGERDFTSQGKTIPSASATYTLNLYAVREDGVFRYVNWNEKEGVATHSLKQTAQLENVVSQVQQALPKLPRSPNYILVASNERLRPYFSLMEAGYSTLHILLQAYALNLESNVFVMRHDEMRMVKETLRLTDTPIALIPVGNAPFRRR